MQVIFKFIKTIFLKLGVEIKFVKKENEVSAIKLNEVSEVDKAWSDPAIIKKFFSQQNKKLYKEIIDLVVSEDLDLSGDVADIGCGAGILLQQIDVKFQPKSISGFEFSKEALKFAQKQLPNASFIQHDIYKPVDTYYFDAVFSTEVLEHLLNPEMALENILKVKSKEGFVLITVPDGRKDTFEGHINFWSIESWEVFIKSNLNNKFNFKVGKLGEHGLFALIK